jgi:predicted secreted protein
MLNSRIKLMLRFCIVCILSFSFIGGDCSTNGDEDLPPENSVASPGSFTFKVEAVAGGDSRVVFNWTASADENETDFKGYRITTVELNNSNQVVSTFQEQALGKNIKTHNINPLERGKRYRTLLVAELNNGIKSNTLQTDIYAGVFYNTDGKIDAYFENSSSMSGYGWDFETGVGTQYPYTQSNAGKMDIHLEEFRSAPYFFSPSLDTGFKLTRMKNIGSGQTTFDETDLPEADETFLPVNLGDVYLVKTEEGFYAKVWIKSITPPGTSQNYYTITFDYKLQPINGLRIL